MSVMSHQIDELIKKQTLRKSKKKKKKKNAKKKAESRPKMSKRYASSVRYPAKQPDSSDKTEEYISKVIHDLRYPVLASSNSALQVKKTLRHLATNQLLKRATRG